MDEDVTVSSARFFCNQVAGTYDGNMSNIPNNPVLVSNNKL